MQCTMIQDMLGEAISTTSMLRYKRLETVHILLHC